jgi:phosphatidate cytidylyltransferase
MLLWRIVVSAVLISVLGGVCWMDHLAAIPGLWFLPLGCVLLVLASAELIQILEVRGLKAQRAVVYGGNVLLLVGGWLPNIWNYCCPATAVPLDKNPWPLFCLAFCLFVAFSSAMRRFTAPGETMNVLAATIFAVAYLGVTFSFLAQLRFEYGMGALISLILVVKVSDTGAYFIGRLIGRHKMTPRLSPGKTWEGAVGGILIACFTSLLIAWVVNVSFFDAWRWLLYGGLLGVAGIFGDLAESLLKRDAGVKNSSLWLPGLGGVLDVMDSLLLAAPLAWFCWTIGLVYPV